MSNTERLIAALAAVAQADEPMIREAAAESGVKVAFPGGSLLRSLLSGVYKPLANISRFGRAGSEMVAPGMLSKMWAGLSGAAKPMAKAQVNKGSIGGVLQSILRPNRALLNYNRQYIGAPGLARRALANTADVATHGLITLPMLMKGRRAGRDAGTAEGLQQAFAAAQQYADSLPFMDRIGLIMNRGKQASVKQGGLASMLMGLLGIPIGVGVGANMAGKAWGRLNAKQNMPQVGLDPSKLNLAEKLRYIASGGGGGKMVGVGQ